jgi:hypothetical protein
MQLGRRWNSIETSPWPSFSRWRCGLARLWHPGPWPPEPFYGTVTFRFSEGSGQRLYEESPAKQGEDNFLLPFPALLWDDGELNAHRAGLLRNSVD